jgi:hypothetical protein
MSEGEFENLLPFYGQPERKKTAGTLRYHLMRELRKFLPSQME